MKKHTRKFCAATTVAAVLLSASPIATPVAHAGWGSVIGGVIGGILNGGGGGNNGGGALGGMSNQQHAHPNPNDHEKLFILAVEKNDIGTANEMLKAGVDVNGVWPSGYYSSYNRKSKTALMIAIQNNNREMMQFLLENGADVTGFYMYDNRHISYFEYVMSLNSLHHGLDTIDLAQFLLDWGADINGTSDRGNVGEKNYPLDNYPSSINDVYEDDDYVRVQFLLEHGAYTENRGFDGNTPFLRAVDYKFVRLMNLLADGGANINAKDKKGRNALQIALDKNDLQLYKQIQDIMARGQQSSQYQPSKPQSINQTNSTNDTNEQGDNLVVFENKSANPKARLQEIHDVLEIIKDAEINENKGTNGLLKLMQTMTTMPTNERSSKVKDCISFLEKSVAQIEPSKILSKLKNCTPEEKEIFSDALQIKITRRERFLEGVRIYALERELTQEDLNKATTLLSSSQELFESDSESWKRVMEVCNK